MRFSDRAEAGRRLAARLGHLRGPDVVVLGLPRGGVPVASEVAAALGAPLDVIVVRKLGVPFQPELAMGAVGEGGTRVVNEDIVRSAGVSRDEIAAAEERERTEVERRARSFRGRHPRVPLAGRTALVVDDGIATGATAVAACEVARAEGAGRVVLAVPVAAAQSLDRLRAVADEIVCLEIPDPFLAVGQWYDDFSQVTDSEVVTVLESSARTAARPEHVASGRRAAPDPDPIILDEDVSLDIGPVTLRGHVTVPSPMSGVVVFAHGSGSSRHSPRNRHVAATLNRRGCGTVLFDLLTEAEELDRANVFDIATLAERLDGVRRWTGALPVTDGAPVGYFGASTGAAAALWAASLPAADVAAVVSRGGRPDLASGRLAQVRAPTLLIVGGHDEMVLELNRQAQAEMTCETKLEVVPGATHLFEEPGTLDDVARSAGDWFTDWFTEQLGAR